MSLRLLSSSRVRSGSIALGVLFAGACSSIIGIKDLKTDEAADGGDTSGTLRRAAPAGVRRPAAGVRQPAAGFGGGASGTGASGGNGRWRHRGRWRQGESRRCVEHPTRALPTPKLPVTTGHRQREGFAHGHLRQGDRLSEAARRGRRGHDRQREHPDRHEHFGHRCLHHGRGHGHVQRGGEVHDDGEWVRGGNASSGSIRA